MARSSSPQRLDGRSVSFGQLMRRGTSDCGAVTCIRKVPVSSLIVAHLNGLLPRRWLAGKRAPTSAIRRLISRLPHRRAGISTDSSLWSDLHWSQLDADPEHREIEVSVQQTIENASDKFAGVIRVGLLAQQLDRAVQLKLTPAEEPDPHRIFLADREGRLITRGVGSDRAAGFG